MNAVSPVAPIQQDEPQFTARDGILETVLDQLTPMYQTIYGAETGVARQAALDAMSPYLADDRTDLAVAGQVVACGLAAMRVFQMCMQPDAKPADLARLCRTADTLSRTEHRYRTTGLYPEQTAPKPRTPAVPVLVPASPPREKAVPPEPSTPPRQTAPAPAASKPEPLLPHDDFHQLDTAMSKGRLNEFLAGEGPSGVERSLRNRIAAELAKTGPQADVPDAA